MTTTEDQLFPELQACCDEFESCREEALKLSDTLSEEQFVWKPAADRWSAAECIGHLNKTGTLLLPRLEKAIADGHKNGVTGSPPFRYGLLSQWFIRGMDPASSLRMKTFKLYEPDPPEQLSKESVIAEFLELQNALRQLAIRANGLDLKRIKVASPVSRLLRLDLGAWFAATVSHEKRHIAQARRVLIENNL